MEHRLRLTTITGLFAIITTLSLREQRCLVLLDARIIRKAYSIYLSRLVLRDLVLCVLSTVLALAVSASCLWDVDLWNSY